MGLNKIFSNRLTAIAVAVPAVLLSATPARSQSAEEMAKKLQDPLASIAALMTDNTVNFGTGDDERTGYNFQLQPVYSIPFEKFNFIPRAVIPIVGAPGGADFPNLPPGASGDNTQWGLSDMTVQTFFNPKSEGGLKWGVGPQVSLKTRTSERVAGPGWGAGPGGVIVGGAGDFSYAVLISQHWAFDGNFSLATVQPSFFYNIPSMPGGDAPLQQCDHRRLEGGLRQQADGAARHGF